MRQVGVGWRETPGRPDRPEPRTLTRTRSELSPAGRSAGGGADRQLVHVVGSGGWVCVSPAGGGGGVGRPEPDPPWPACGATRPPPADAVRSMCRASGPSPAVSRGPLALPPSHPHSLGLSLISLSLSLSARILSLVATAKESIAHDSRLRVRWRGSRAQSAERATHTERWLHLPCPVFFPCHTHALGLHCMCCQRDLHAIRPSIHVVDANRQSIEEERSISSGERGEG